MEDIAPSVVAVVVIVGLTAMLRPEFDSFERRVMWGSLFLHLFSSVVQVLMTRYYYGDGDMLGYHRGGVIHARGLQEDLGEYLPLLLRYIGLDETAPFPLSGTATGAMIGVSGLILYLVGGSSLYAANLLVAGLSFYSKVVMHQGMRDLLAPTLRRRVAIATMLLPSAVFWSSALLKETIAVIGLGPLVWALRLMFRGERVLFSLIVATASSLLVVATKPYVLFAFIIAAGCSMYMRSVRRGGGQSVFSKPLRLGATLAIVYLAILGLGEAFPRYSMENLSDETAKLQEVGQQFRGGSTISGFDASGGVQAQIEYAPIALMNSLSRPFLFEAHNVAALIGAVEMSFLLGLVVLSIRRTGFWAGWAEIKKNPMLFFALVFTVTLGIAIGLGTTNLGSLSRYRIPFMPFYAGTLAFLSVPGGAVPTGNREQSPPPGPQGRVSTMRAAEAA